MRIAYVINSLEGGGASKPVPAIARVLAAHGAEIHILALTPRDRRGLAAMIEAGLTVSIREGGERDHLAALRWLDRQMLDWQPDLIWTSLTRATLLGQIVGQNHGIDVVSWQHAAYLKPVNALLLRLRQNRSRLWIADSQCVAATTQQRLGIDRDRIATWPLFSADEQAPQAAPWKPGSPLRIGSLGRLHPVKGYDVLLDALGRLRASGFAPPALLEVEIAGEGAQREALVAQAKAAGLEHVRFVGFSEPRAFLASLHLYVQPSRSEGLCIAAHEAMQAGLPLIASAVGEMPYSLFGEGCGRTVPPDDPHALAIALAELIRAPHNLRQMGQAARRRVVGLFGGDAFARAGADVLDRISRARATSPRNGQGRSASRDPTDRSAWHRST